MALAETPPVYDPTGKLMEQRLAYVREGVIFEITQEYLDARAAAQAADDAADALLSPEDKAIDDAAEAAAEAEFQAKVQDSWET